MADEGVNRKVSPPATNIDMQTDDDGQAVDVSAMVKGTTTDESAKDDDPDLAKEDELLLPATAQQPPLTEAAVTATLFE